MGEQIAEFLVRHNGQAFCDNCLRGALKTKNVRAVERATTAMGANPAEREVLWPARRLPRSRHIRRRTSPKCGLGSLVRIGGSPVAVGLLQMTQQMLGHQPRLDVVACWISVPLNG
jgi:hypothetical protein